MVLHPVLRLCSPAIGRHRLLHHVCIDRHGVLEHITPKSLSPGCTSDTPFGFFGSGFVHGRSGTGEPPARIRSDSDSNRGYWIFLVGCWTFVSSCCSLFLVGYWTFPGPQNRGLSRVSSRFLVSVPETPETVLRVSAMVISFRKSYTLSLEEEMSSSG